jgi:hypothetical protein
MRGIYYHWGELLIIDYLITNLKNVSGFTLESPRPFYAWYIVSLGRITNYQLITD